MPTPSKRHKIKEMVHRAVEGLPGIATARTASEWMASAIGRFKSAKNVYKKRPSYDVGAAKNIEAGMSVETARRLRKQEIEALKKTHPAAFK